MDHIHISRDFPIYKKVEVLVVGGGPGGVAAAFAAAKNGAQTMIVERTEFLGGNMGQGLVMSVHGYRSDQDYMAKKLPCSDWSNPLVVKTPVTMEIYNRILAGGGTAFPERRNDPSLRENVDEEVVVYVLDQMAKELGIEVLFDTVAFDAVMEGDKIVGVVIANKSGPQVILADVIIDCSADADIAARAGAEYMFGDEELGRPHGISLLFEMGGIDFERFFSYLKNRPVPTPEEKAALKQDIIKYTNGGVKSPDAVFFMGGQKGESHSTDGQMHMEGKHLTWEEQEQAYREGKFLSLRPCVDAEWIEYLKEHPETPFMPNTLAPEPMYPWPPAFTWYGIVRNGKVRYDQAVSGVHECFVDPTNAAELSKALVTCREINQAYINFFREKIPGFENAYIYRTGNYGGRESRQIIGEYVLTLQDLADGTWFDDTIAVLWRANNLHLLTGQKGQRMWFVPQRKFTVPYRCLVPKTVDNLLIGGRPISKVHAVRCSSMVPCMQYGEACGAAAAVCIKNGTNPRNVNVYEVQTILGLQDGRDNNRLD